MTGTKKRRVIYMSDADWTALTTIAEANGKSASLYIREHLWPTSAPITTTWTGSPVPKPSKVKR